MAAVRIVDAQPHARIAPDVLDPVRPLAPNEDVPRPIILEPERRDVRVAVLGQRPEPADPGPGQKLRELIVREPRATRGRTARGAILVCHRALRSAPDCRL